MYQAKRNGRSRIVVHSGGLHGACGVTGGTALQSLAGRQDSAHFQPVIRLCDSRLVGLEVMAR